MDRIDEEKLMASVDAINQRTKKMKERMTVINEGVKLLAEKFSSVNQVDQMVSSTKEELVKDYIELWKEPVKKVLFSTPYAIVPLPVLWDRKKEINNKHYSNRDWVCKMIEEVTEVSDSMAFEKSRDLDEKGRASARKITNLEIMDVITVCISLLEQRGIKAGSPEWDELVNDTNEKNNNRGALEEHPEKKDSGGNAYD